MADSKKYNGSTWQHSLRKLTTATDTFTTLPVDIYADGNNATVGISGNTVQSGTPTPDNPIMPQGTGDKTANLFDVNGSYSYKHSSVSVANNELYINPVGAGAVSRIYYSTEYVAGTYTISANKSGNIGEIRLFSPIDFEGSTYNAYYGGYFKTIPSNGLTVTFSTPFTIGIIAGRLEEDVSSDGRVYNLTLNSGSTAKSYEPYGYKIPISSASTTTPVYLGEVETTRKVKKLVLTGNEDWSYIAGATSPSAYYRFKVGSINSVVANAEEICTHYQQKTISSSSTDIGFSMQNSSGYNGAFAAFRPYENSSESELATWKTYLQQQYANGTPVTVWYILATEETAVVNEPLCKIGDYADTVSGITVPTITGKDTFDVETTLKPSEASLSYTGWHDATVEEWDGSQWNE